MYNLSRCTVSSVQKRYVAIARLRSPANLGRTSQEVWFVILVVTSTKEVFVNCHLCRLKLSYAIYYTRAPNYCDVSLLSVLAIDVRTTESLQVNVLSTMWPGSNRACH